MGLDKTRHIAFVDDESGVRNAVRKILERNGMHVRCFGDADDCLAHLAEGRCDLLVTDVKMPGKDGIQLLQEVKEQRPSLPILVLTGYADVPMAVRALKMGAADFLEKPLDRDAFLKTVTTLLEQNSPQVALSELGLTGMELKVLYLLLDGKNNHEIAKALNRSPRTIEVHRSHMMRKMGAENIVGVLRRAVEMGLFETHWRDGQDGACR